MAVRFSKFDAPGRAIVITVTFSDEAFQQLTREMGRRARNIRPWAGVFFTTFQKAHQRRFSSRGGFGGVAGKWAVPYSQKYEKQKKAKYGHLKKELAKEKMYRSLTSFTPSTFKTVTYDSVTMGTQAKVKRKTGMFHYPATQQFGARTRLGDHQKGARKKRPSEKKIRYKTRIPPRPPMITKWPRQILSGVTSSLMEYITTGRVRYPRF